MTQAHTTDGPQGLGPYLRVYMRSKGVSVPDPEADDNGAVPGEPATQVPTLETPTPTPNPTPSFHPPFESHVSSVDATATQGPQLVVHDAQGDLISPFRLDNAHNAPPRSFDDIRKASTWRNNENDNDNENKNDMLLGINVLVDDAYSEASSRFKAKRSHFSTSRSWRKAPVGFESDSDEEKRGAKDGEGEAWDTDLDSQASQSGVRRPREHARKMWKWKALVANRYEYMFLECIVNIDGIPPNYENMFVDPSVTRELERVTKLSLERKKAFNHGVLQGNRVTGAVLWGPPGTGKTLLTKGLARQSGCNMLSISTAELWQKCHGEDEKVIKGLFTFAKKLHPCIIFLDEADAMLGTRKAGEKRHVRSMINQFLMSWDGLGSSKDSPFVLLATNRPFDLDPAVLRRAPVHIELGLPNLAMRRGILGLLLRAERLEDGLTVDLLARTTDRYSGSDLKNMSVTAATLAVEEQHEDTDIRTLTLAHFKQAMKKVRPVALSAVNKNELENFGRRGRMAGAAGGAHAMHVNDEE